LIVQGYAEDLMITQSLTTSSITNLRIRNAGRTDLEGLEWEGEYTHFRRLFRDTYQLVEQDQAKILIAEVKQNYLIGQLFVSLKGARPELADGNIRAYVYGFRVRPAYRNQGVGGSMMNAVELDLLQNGFKLITLNVAKVNHAARRFYERLGYKVVGSDPGRWSYLDHFDKKHDVHEPAWRMEKSLR
jgi:ribosomal protein S18 acetylase RimI-like enzyme